MDKVRLGIIGLGKMGSSYMKIAAGGNVADMELTAVADVLPDKRAQAVDLLGSKFPVFTSHTELFNSGLVDAVFIVVPHYHHTALTIEAFNAGLHVLCDKPAGVWTKQVREMNDAAAKSGKVFALMFNQRTTPSYRKMRELVSEGSMGSLIRANWVITDWLRNEQYYQQGGWRGTWDGEGGGVLINQCPHQLDLLQWICGMPQRVRAFCHNGKWHNIEVEDDVTAYFEFPGGATGTFIAGTGEYPGANRFELSLDGGKIINEGGKDLTLFRLNRSLSEVIPITTEYIKHIDYTTEKPEIDSVDPEHAGVLRAFAGRILRNETLVAEGYEGINSLLLSNAMYLSSWLDTTIEIPFDEDLFLAELNKRRKGVMHGI